MQLSCRFRLSDSRVLQLDKLRTIVRRKFHMDHSSGTIRVYDVQKTEPATYAIKSPPG